MTQSFDGPERIVMEQLLESDTSQPVDLRGISQRLGWPLLDLARVFFALNRTKHLRVSMTPPAPVAQRSLAALTEPLQELTRHGGPALLASNDGLCIAAVGLTAQEADQRAALWQAEAGSSVTQTTLKFAHESVTLIATSELDPTHPAWVELARHLLPTCGRLTPIREKTE
jgi:hypothetical protein